MSETMIGSRVEWDSQLLNPGEFAKLPDGTWYAQTPNDHTVNLRLHAVVEHEDGTITVAPSIVALSAPDDCGEPRSQSERQLWHGFLEHGVWREC